MSKYIVPNITSGFDDALVGLSTTLPIFVPMLLIFVFGVVFLGGFTSQKRKTGFADVPMWATMASLSTFMVALPLTLTAGIIGIETLSIVVVVTILSGFWLFTSRNRNEI